MSLISVNKRVTDLFFNNKDSFDIDLEREKLTNHLKRLDSFSSREYILYKKWRQIQRFDNTRDIIRSSVVQTKLWSPRDIFDEEKTLEDIDNIYPQLLVVDDTSLYGDDWYYLRHFIHPHVVVEDDSCVRIIVRDKMTDKYLGIISLTTPLNSDENHMIASTIAVVATEPFGYNFIGNNFIANCIGSEEISAAWYNRYENYLTRIVATTIEHELSVYDNSDWKLGNTSVLSTPVDADDEYYKKWCDVLEADRMAVQKVWYDQGVYDDFAYDDHQPNEHTFRYWHIVPSGTIHHKMGDWKEDAIARYINLLRAGQLNPDKVYYKDLIQMKTWDKVKETYLND